MMIKALAGGGGRGMRLVRAAEELDERLRPLPSEALTAFGDGDGLRRASDHAQARHIEVQVAGRRHDGWSTSGSATAACSAAARS